ncbi:23S rRNA (guanosine(2251)-2'-O)-methyltransferase RlmB [Balneicella halophila]|nr:23S rRNA (guanosine(2251)-2'-O)-methyltransferase RlmB [Balneicella halophila]
MESKQKDDYIYGIRSVLEAIEAEQEINTIFVKEGLNGELASKLMGTIKNLELKYQYVPVQKLVSLGAKNHQGVVASIAPVRYHDLKELLPQLLEEKANPLILLLDRITDVRNFGAIARSAECAGADAIIIPIRNAAKVSADAIKTSAGALYTLPVCRELNMKKTVKNLLKSGFKVVAATEKAEQLYTEVDYNFPTVIVMGSEDTGIDEEILRFATEEVAIPLKGKISSLNVAAAATVLLYEVVRQRG